MPQSLANILVHVIFSTKNRAPLIAPEIEGELYPYLASICHACKSPSHAVGGIGQSQLPALKRYIANQKEHHRRWTFQEELWEFLKRYQVAYDERFVWDWLLGAFRPYRASHFDLDSFPQGVALGFHIRPLRGIWFRAPLVSPGRCVELSYSCPSELTKVAGAESWHVRRGVLERCPVSGPEPNGCRPACASWNLPNEQHKKKSYRSYPGRPAAGSRRIAPRRRCAAQT